MQIGKKFLITGVQGVGKTTIARNDLLSEDRFHRHHFGDTMLDIAIAKGYAKRNAKVMPQLTDVIREELQNDALNAIKNQFGNIIIDGHLIVPSNKGFLPGLKSTLIKELEIEAIFILISTPENIVERRRKNPNLYNERLKKWDDIKSVEIHQNLLLSVATNCSFEFNIPINIIFNENDKIKETVREIWNILNIICDE